MLSTTIIESGLDIPNANTIIIDRADRFGLSDLYQLRGRVGRYKHQAYAYLLLPRHASLLTDVRKRISAMKQYSTLGSGFKIAMRDLEIRGAGNLLGSEQSGHITAVGFELYCQLLKQSVSSLKGEKVKPRVEVRIALDFLEMNGRDGVPPSQNENRWGKAPDEPGVAGSSGSRGTLAPPFWFAPQLCYRTATSHRNLSQARAGHGQTCARCLANGTARPFRPATVARGTAAGRGRTENSRQQKAVTAIEVEEDKLKITRHNDFITFGGKFPRLTKKEAKARLQEIKRLLLAI